MPKYRTADIRVRKYELGVIPDNVRAKFDALKPFMLDFQEVAQSEIVSFETKVKAILDEQGVSGPLRVMYLNFGRALYRAAQHQGGSALNTYALAEKSKCVQLGLVATILDRIAQAVIGWVPY